MIEEETENPKRYYLDYQMKVDSTMLLEGIFKGDTLHLELKKNDLEKLPLLQKDFEWAWDE
jgi:hypothetical protein